MKDEKEDLIRKERENQHEILLLEIEKTKYSIKDHPNYTNLEPYHTKLKSHKINIQNYHGGTLIGLFEIISLKAEIRKKS